MNIMKMLRRGWTVAVVMACVASPALLGDQLNDDTLHWPIEWVELDAASTRYYPIGSRTVKMDVDGRIEMKVRFKSLGTVVVFAQGTTDNGPSSQLQLLLVNGQWRMTYGGSTVLSTKSAQSGVDYNICFEVKNGTWSVVVNDETVIGPVNVGTPPAVPPDDRGLTFWHRHLSGAWGNCPANFRFYFARVYHADGTLQAEFLPEFGKINSIGFYDTQSGAADASAHYKADFERISRDIRDYFCVTNSPVGGREVSNVTSGNGTFLMTGCRLEGTDRVEMKFKFAASTDHRTIISSGSFYGGHEFELLGLNSGTWRATYFGKLGTGVGRWAVDTDYTVSMSVAGGLVVNDVKLCDLPNSATDSFVAVDGLSFFSRILSQNTRYTTAMGCMILSWAKVYDKDGNVKADFAPYITAEGWPGLWDKVGDVVYLPYAGALSADGYDGMLNVVYVAGDARGSDSYQGTQKRPIRNLATAVSRLRESGVAYLMEGTNALADVIYLNGARRIEGLSTDPSRTVITAGSDHRVMSIFGTGGTLRNVTLSGGSFVGRGFALYTEGATVENCIFENNTGLSPSEWKMEGGAVYASGGTIRNCIFRSNTVVGEKELGSAAMLLGTAKMENCLIYGNRYEGADERACTVYMMDSAQMINCTVADNQVTTASGNHNGTAGIRVDSGNCRVLNCAIFGNRLDSQDSRLNSVARVNAEFASTFEGCMGEYAVNAKCFARPNAKFADTANGDYSLTKDSPLINRGVEYAGSDKDAYGTDFAGNPRNVGRRIDVGAYEWQGIDPTGLIVIIR